MSFYTTGSYIYSCGFLCAFFGGEIIMNLNLFFLTITIKKRNVPMEEYVHEENVQRMYEQMKERQYTMINNY